MKMTKTMKKTNRKLGLSLLALAGSMSLALTPAPAQADVLNFQVNITGTEGLNDPSALRFLLSGNPTNSSNGVTLSNFDFGNTGLGGTVTSGSPTLSDDLAFNRFNQNFTPGDSLSFNLALNTDSADVGSANGPDLFTLAILNGTSGPRLVTTAPDGVSFFTFSFDSLSNPSFASYQSAAMDASGNAQPVLVATVTAVPEPATWLMMALGMGAIVWTQQRRKRTQVAEGRVSASSALSGARLA